MIPCEEVAAWLAACDTLNTRDELYVVDCDGVARWLPVIDSETEDNWLAVCVTASVADGPCEPVELAVWVCEGVDE